ncbi:MAG: hypothetical protein RLY14_1421 [Planctomycetota bacterium]
MRFVVDGSTIKRIDLVTWRDRDPRTREKTGKQFPKRVTRVQSKRVAIVVDRSAVQCIDSFVILVKRVSCFVLSEAVLSAAVLEVREPQARLIFGSKQTDSHCRGSLRGPMHRFVRNPRQESLLFRAQRSGAQRSGARAQRSGARSAGAANPAHFRIKAIRFEPRFPSLKSLLALQRHSSTSTAALSTSTTPDSGRSN